MEAILRTVLLRQQQMATQWDAEFEQQKQLFHINTSTLIDMLPVQPRKKRHKVDSYRQQPGPTPSHDKENFIGLQGFLPSNGFLESPKTKAPHSRGLAKRDLNTRFCDNDVKSAGRMEVKPLESLGQPSLYQSAWRNCLDADNPELNTRIVHGVRDISQVTSRQVSVKIEADEGGSCDIRVPSASEVEIRKRSRGGEDKSIALQMSHEEIPDAPVEDEKQADRIAIADVGEENSKSKRARKVGINNERSVEVKDQLENASGDSEVVKAVEPEIESNVGTGETMPIFGADADVVKVEIEPVNVSKAPSRRGRAAKCTSTASRAAMAAVGSDVVSKEPVRRGRSKQASTVSGAAVPQIAPRVTRSRARKAESVVESESGICEQLSSSQVACKASDLQGGGGAVVLPRVGADFPVGVGNSELKPCHSLSHCKDEEHDRSSKLVLRPQIEKCDQVDVSTSAEKISNDVQRSSKASQSRLQKPVTRFARKGSEISPVALGMTQPDDASNSARITSQEDTVFPVPKTEVEGVRVDSRIAEARASAGNVAVYHVKNDQHMSLSQLELRRIEVGVGQREVDLTSAAIPFAMRDATERQVRNEFLTLLDARTAREVTGKIAPCIAALEGDILPDAVYKDLTKGGSQSRCDMIGDNRHASISEAQHLSARLASCEAAELCHGKDVTQLSNAPSSNEMGARKVLLSETMNDNISHMKQSSDPVAFQEKSSLVRSRQSSHKVDRIASVTSLDLSEAGKEGSAGNVELQTAACVAREPTPAGRDESRENPLKDVVASEQEGMEDHNVIEKRSNEANVLFAKRTWQVKRASMQDAFMGTTSEGSRVNEPNDLKEFEDAGSTMNMAREQGHSDAVSPVRYSEARAIEEAMGCSLEQEFHPEVTLTLNRFQFRKRLSPRSKARARRWRSDVATNGVDYVRGQSSDAPAASPSKAISSRDRSLEGVAYETFLEAQSPNPEEALQQIEPAFSFGALKSVDQADTIPRQVEHLENGSQAEESCRRSIATLCNEVCTQTFQDGEVGDNTVEYEIMETANEKNGNSLSPLPLLRSIYMLSKACQNDMAGARGILEDEDQQQVHTLIESAKKIIEQLSSKRAHAVGALPTTPASTHPALKGSRFNDHTNLYPDRFRLFITPKPSSAPPSMLPSSSNIFPVVVLQDDIEVNSPPVKHLNQEIMEQDFVTRPCLDSILPGSAISSDNIESPARAKSCSLADDGKLQTTSCTDNSQSKEGVYVPASESGLEMSRLSDSVHKHRNSDALPNTIVCGALAIGSASAHPGCQKDGILKSCNGSKQSTRGPTGTVDTVEHSTRQTDNPDPWSFKTIGVAENSTETMSRFSAQSKDDVVGTYSTAKDVLHLLGTESLISHPTHLPTPVQSLRFSPGCASNHHSKTSLSSKKVHFEAGDPEVTAAIYEGDSRIPCSPVFIVKQSGQDDSCHVLGTSIAVPSFPHLEFQKTVIPEAETFIPDSTSEPSNELVLHSQLKLTSSPASMLRVEPQCSSNLINAVPGSLASNPGLPRSNLVSSMRSFIPLVQHQQPAAPYPNGKRDVKVKALEAAEAARRAAEQKELEKQERKKAAELAKREKLERAAQDKLAKKEKAAQEKLLHQEARAEESNKRKAVAAGTTKSILVDSASCKGSSNQNMLVKVKKTYELKLKMDQDKQERLLEEQRRKEEDWKKKEAENAARKRKHEAAEKKEKMEKRRRLEEVMKANREMEERQRLELERKAQKQKALEEMEKERKTIEEEIKRQKRLEKEKEVEQRRKKEEERELAWLESKEATRKRKEEAAKQLKLLESEGYQQAAKILRSSEDPTVPVAGPYHSFLASLHTAMGVGDGIGAALPSGVNNLVDPQRPSSHSLIGHPLRVPQQSGEGAGACRNSQTAMRVPRTTPEGAHGVSSTIVGSGQPLFRTPPEAFGNPTGASIVVTGGIVSSTKVLRDRAINVPQDQHGSKTGVNAVALGSKLTKPVHNGFSGPPGGVIRQGDKGLQSYEISPYRDSEDEDSDEEEKRSQKPIPQWARKEHILSQLVRQLEQDPDDIFIGASSCSLDEVFEVKGSKKRPDFKRRGSSGDWVKDCLTWQEQIQYKVTMGYLH